MRKYIQPMTEIKVDEKREGKWKGKTNKKLSSVNGRRIKRERRNADEWESKRRRGNSLKENRITTNT